jgi:hypothetical protein
MSDALVGAINYLEALQKDAQVNQGKKRTEGDSNKIIEQIASRFGLGAEAIGELKKTKPHRKWQSG